MGNFCWNDMNFGQSFNGTNINSIASPIPSSKTKRVHCPYGKPNDRLWVRETHWMDIRDDLCAVMDLDGFAVDIHPAGKNKFVEDLAALKNNKFWKKRPSIHMPRWASRILLDVVNVRVERLNDISEDDAVAEGIKICPNMNGMDGSVGYVWPDSDYDRNGLCNSSAVTAFLQGWEIINGPGSWDLNPWVWVVEF